MISMLYNIIDICNYIINHEDTMGRSVSNLRLQKLLYFVQAQFLVAKNEPCFADTIEAWDFGPVVPNAYHHYKIYGGSIIPANTKTVNLPAYDKSLIDQILDQCAKFSTTALVSITHHQDPWINARNSFNNIISLESIKKFFDVKEN